MKIVGRFFVKLSMGIFLFLIPVQVLAFNVSDLAKYSTIAVKTLAKNDSLYKGNNSTSVEIQGTKALINVLGTDKVYYDTQFVYKGDKEIEHEGETTWYYYTPKSLNGNRKYKLYYRKNDVMRAAYAGDTLVIARKDDEEILLLIAQKGSDFERQVYDTLGLKIKNDDKVSFWKKLFGKDNKEIETDYIQDPAAAVSDKKWIEIYFTPGSECENNIIAEINQAKKIDIAVYSITNQNIVDAIIDAKERGAKIRVITDRLQSKGKYSLVDEIESAGIPVITNTGHKIMHNKFAVFDGKRIESGSYNWTESATESNAENCMFFEQEDKAFTKQFDYLWNLYQK